MKPLLCVFICVLTAVAAAQTAPAAAPTLQTTASGLVINLPPNQAQEPGVQKAFRLLDQMVQALGGPAWMNLRDYQQEGRTYSFYHGQSTGAGAPFWRFWKWPDKDRLELTKQRDWIVIYNGDQGYEVTFKGVAPVEKAMQEDYLRRRHYSLEEVMRQWLRQPGVAIFYEGHSIAERKPAEQVSILNAQNESLTIWMDGNSHLPLKKSFTWRDPKTRDRTDEAEGYDNYRLVQGVQMPVSITRYKDGEAVNQRFITSVSVNQNLPDSLFEPKAPQKK
jgi:hypothetical protein